MDELGIGGELKQLDRLRQQEHRRRRGYDGTRHRDHGADRAIVLARLLPVRAGGRLLLDRGAVTRSDTLAAVGLLKRGLGEGGGLLQLLVERRRTVTDPELAYVAWHEIADALSFRSVQADSENVRELVHRVRRKLGAVQADDLIESKRGVGYRLAGEPG